MRNLRRLGILAAATTLAGSAALAGAGVAGAQGDPAYRTDSPSTVTVARVSGEVVVTYSNQSEYVLYCGVVIGNSDYVGEMYQWMTTWSYSEPEPEPPASVVAALAAAMAAGEYTDAAFVVQPGATGPVTYLEDHYPDGLAPNFTDPEAVSTCVQGEAVVEPYAELETTTTGGGGGLFGSLEQLIPSFGS